jgi:hypothetical protein
MQEIIRDVKRRYVLYLKLLFETYVYVLYIERNARDMGLDTYVWRQALQ